MTFLHLRIVAATAAVIAVSGTIYGRAQAGDKRYFPPVTHEQTRAECGSCHLAYPASMLPAASWRKLMAGLNDHFGDDASIDAKTAAAITDYLVAQAGDEGGRASGRKLLRGLPAGTTPLRITELPRWMKEHREIAASEWKRKDVVSKSNCAACHQRAEFGDFDDE